MEKKRHIPFEAIMSFVMMIISGAIITDGMFIHKLSWDAIQYPLVCCLVVFAMAMIEIVKSLAGQKKKEKTESIYHNRKNFFLVAGMLIAYVILMWLFGFMFSSIALTICFTVLFKIQKPVLINIGAGIAIIAIYFVFNKILYIFLPKGMLFNLFF